MENNTPTVTPKMEFWGWLLSIFATFISVGWIFYQAYKERKTSD
jgi:hypothetical protein